MKRNRKEILEHIALAEVLIKRSEDSLHFTETKFKIDILIQTNLAISKLLFNKQFKNKDKFEVVLEKKVK